MVKNELELRPNALLEIDEMIRYALQRRELDKGLENNISFKEINKNAKVDFDKVTFIKVLSINKNEDEIHSGLTSMRTILNLFRDGKNSIAYYLKSSKKGVDLYLCSIPAPGNNEEARAHGELLSSALEQVNYGIEKQVDSICKKEFGERINDASSVAVIAGVPGTQDENDRKYHIRIDDIVKSVGYKEYSILGIMDPIPNVILDELLKRADNIRSSAASISKLTIQDGYQLSLTRSVTNGYSKSESYTYGESHGTSKGYNVSGAPTGALAGAGIGFLAGGPIGAAIGASIGGGLLGGFSKNKGSTSGSNKSWGKTKTTNYTEGEAHQTSISENVTREYFNKAAERTEQIGQTFADRFDSGKEVGLFNTGVYIFGPEKHTVKNVAQAVRAHISGIGSKIEPVRVLHFDKRKMNPVNPESYKNFTESLKNLRNPIAEHSGHPFGPIFEGVSTPLSGNEAPILFNFPRYEIKGVKVARNARYVPAQRIGDANSFPIGRVFDGARLLPDKLYLDPEFLKHHTFVSGVTGSGKTNTCLNILSELKKKDINFLVVEPAKNHYRSLLSQDSDLRIFTLGNEKPSERLLPFRFNPFHPVRLKDEDGRWHIFNLQAHIDFVKSAIVASLPMEVAMPSILGEAISQSYREFGWDINTSRNHFIKHIETEEFIDEYVPTLFDLRRNVDKVIELKGFDKRLESDYKGALRARIDGLCDGGKGVMLNSKQHIEIGELLKYNTVLELENIPDSSEKSLIMGLILSSLYEYRKLEASITSASDKLKHITLIEEAHHLLSRVESSEDQSNNSSRSKFQEVFTNILSEVRAYGEGLMIVEQIPSKISKDVMKNTSTKVIHKTIDGEDRDLIASALVLDDEQTDDLPFLKKGEFLYVDESLHAVQRIKSDLYIGKPFYKYSYQNPIRSFFKRKISDRLEKLNIDRFDSSRLDYIQDSKVINGYLETITAINIVRLDPEKVFYAFLIEMIMGEKSIRHLGRKLKDWGIVSEENQPFIVIDEEEVGQSLAWAFTISDVIRSALFSREHQDIKQFNRFCSLIEAILVDEVLTTWSKAEHSEDIIGNEQEYISEFRNELLASKILNQAAFDYIGCEECPFKCKYGQIMPNIVDPDEILDKVHTDSTEDYVYYLRKKLENKFENASGKDINEMTQCGISLLSQYNPDVFHELIEKL
jgi:hypothetical protein